MHARHFYPGELTLIAGEPIDTTGMHLREIDDLTEKLKQTIAGLLHKCTEDVFSSELTGLEDVQAE